MRVLLIEDDRALSKMIETSLVRDGFVVDASDLGEDGLEIGRLYEYDIIVLDLMLPDMNGYDVLRRLRDGKVTTPVLILSGLLEADNRIKGLGFGADDYLTKPFHMDELKARIQAIIRRSRGHAEPSLHLGSLKLNVSTQTVTENDEPVQLTGREYKILELLLLRKGHILSKDTFLNHLYGAIDEPEKKIIDVFICKLRKKLRDVSGKNYIETVWGQGYILKDPDDETRT